MAELDAHPTGGHLVAELDARPTGDQAVGGLSPAGLATVILSL